MSFFKSALAVLTIGAFVTVSANAFCGKDKAACSTKKAKASCCATASKADCKSDCKTDTKEASAKTSSNVKTAATKSVAPKQ